MPLRPLARSPPWSSCGRGPCLDHRIGCRPGCLRADVGPAARRASQDLHARGQARAARGVRRFRRRRHGGFREHPGHDRRRGRDRQQPLFRPDQGRAGLGDPGQAGLQGNGAAGGDLIPLRRIDSQHAAGRHCALQQRRVGRVHHAARSGREARQGVCGRWHALRARRRHGPAQRSARRPVGRGCRDHRQCDRDHDDRRGFWAAAIGSRRRGRSRPKGREA